MTCKGFPQGNWEDRLERRERRRGSKGMCVNLENMLLNESSQTQNITYCMIPFK